MKKHQRAQRAFKPTPQDLANSLFFASRSTNVTNADARLRGALNAEADFCYAIGAIDQGRALQKAAEHLSIAGCERIMRDLGR